VYSNKEGERVKYKSDAAFLTFIARRSWANLSSTSNV